MFGKVNFEICRNFELRNIFNMYEIGLFLGDILRKIFFNCFSGKRLK